MSKQPREEADVNRGEDPSITAYPNGPLIVRGNVPILDTDGQPLPRNRRTVALCRCGASTIKPWCDGSHKLTGFSTAEPLAEPLPADPQRPCPT